MQVAKPFLLTLEIIFCLANGIYKLSLMALTSLLIPPMLFHTSKCCLFLFCFLRYRLSKNIVKESDHYRNPY